jgi:hypothetical protein
MFKQRKKEKKEGKRDIKVSTRDMSRLIVDCQSQLLLLMLLLYSNVSFVLVRPTFGFLQDLEEAEIGTRLFPR